MTLHGDDDPPADPIIGRRWKDPVREREELRQFLGGHRGRILKALALALGTSREEVCRRLRVAEHDLVIARPVPPPSPSRPRPRGRPRRKIDRTQLIEALRRTDGHCPSAAKILGLPRNTLKRHLIREPVPAIAYAYGPGITEAHAMILANSGVSSDVARRRSYQSVWRKGGQLLEIPVWSERGVRVWSQFRLDHAVKHRNRYRNGAGACPTIDVSPFGRQLVLDSDRTLYVTESPRKADAAVSLGLACVAMMGVGMLCLDDDAWRYVGVEGRSVRIVFDSDGATNPDVRRAECQLATYLTGLGAQVEVVRLPGHKVGLDDFLAGGHDVAALEALPRVDMCRT